MMGYATEELWFSDVGERHATPWENPAAYERFNPIDHVASWTKPHLVIHCGRDFRIRWNRALPRSRACSAAA